MEKHAELQKWVLTELKASVIPQPIVNSRTVESNTTRKEPVNLPEFKSGPYLQYPTWRKQWDLLVVEYPERWRSSVLNKKVDSEARKQYVGFETDYEEAMRRLDAFYGNPQKVIDCVMDEVVSPQAMIEGDYRSLISYSTILENNFNRLKNLDLEDEMSNASTMKIVLRKFPRVIGEKWQEKLNSQSAQEKRKPFPHFILWLTSQKEIWERMVAAGISGDKPGSKALGFFAGADSFTGQCYKCGDTGHKRQDCKNSGSNGGGGKRDNATSKRPSVKKFWCAFHKGDPGKRCTSIMCADLRKMADAAKRVQMLKENGDCQHCCGDHKAAECSRKSRVCGGGKDDRGCSQSHNLHELFCNAARVFHVHAHSALPGKSSSDGVVLLIMNVRSVKGNVASVFWDGGCSSNFVREAFAKICGFKGHEETLCVTTLGGVVTDYHKVISYKCSLRTVDGDWLEFEAYGMECITGALMKIHENTIRKLFPRLDRRTVECLKRGSNVDMLIGMKHPSWFPERAERATGGGDFWLYRGMFGVCVGGTHGLINEETKKSDSLFVVNHTYHIDVVSHPATLTNHHLEFCEQRSIDYFKPTLPAVPVTKPDSSAITPAQEALPTISIPPACPISASPASLPASTNVSSSTVFAQQVFPSTTASERLQFISEVTDIPGDFMSSVRDTVPSIAESPVASLECFAAKVAPLNVKDMFFQLESLGTLIEPQCGACKCGKCPVPGSKYSFQEQKEHDIIKKNLTYDETAKRWFTEYPWITPRSALPRNEKQASQVLHALEKRLSANQELAKDFCDQIQAMIDRGAAIILSKEELDAWEGDYYYLPLVGVKGKKNVLQVCFDASRKQCGFPSMNELQMKGPDRFINDLLSVILAFRNGRVGCVMDIAKFHNQVHLKEKDIHMQRFKWRGMNTDIEPQTYAVKVNNFGVKSANSIATIALRTSADEFAERYPIESLEVKNQTYVDDGATAATDKETAVVKMGRWDEILDHAGMPNKGWICSGDDSANVELGKGDEEITKVLGYI